MVLGTAGDSTLLSENYHSQSLLLPWWSLDIIPTWEVGEPSGQFLNEALTGMSTPHPRDSDKHTAIYFA